MAYRKSLHMVYKKGIIAKYGLQKQTTTYITYNKKIIAEYGLQKEITK